MVALEWRREKGVKELLYGNVGISICEAANNISLSDRNNIQSMKWLVFHK